MLLYKEKKGLENSKPYIHGSTTTVLTHFLKRRRADVGENLIKYGFDHLSHWKTRGQIIDLSDQYKKSMRVTVSQQNKQVKF
jgi:aryl carrier-like protein